MNSVLFLNIFLQFHNFYLLIILSKFYNTIYYLVNQGNYIFDQLTDFLPRRVFDRFVAKHGGNMYFKSFICWNQMLWLVFCQLTSKDRMRDYSLAWRIINPSFIILDLDHLSQGATLILLMKDVVIKSFLEFAYVLIEEASRSCYKTDFEINVDGNVYTQEFVFLTLNTSITVLKSPCCTRNTGK